MLILSLSPVLIMGVAYFITINKGAKPENMFPIILGGSIFLFSGILSFFLRKMGFGAGIVVDQLQGTGA